MIKKHASLRSLGETTVSASLRFPGEITSALLTAAFFIYAFENNIALENQRLGFSLALGLPVFLSITFFREGRRLLSRRNQFAGLLLGTAFVAFHFVLTKDDDTSAYPLRYLQLSLSLHLLVAFVGSFKTDLGFWQLNRAIFLRILYSILTASVFWMGIAIALATSEHLFSLKLNSKLYVYIWIFSAVVLQTWHFLAGLPPNLPDLVNETSYPRALKIFVQNLLIPLVSLYMVILYVYTAKIAITQVWPSGWVSWLISVMSVLGIFNLLLLDPEKNKPEGGWIRSYARAYYILILPLLAVLFIAVGKRTSEYGVTEPRYFLIVLGSLLTGLSLYFIFSRKKSIKLVPISLFAVGMLSLVGPWNANSVSTKSQVTRAREVMERIGVLKDGKIVRNTEAKNESDIEHDAKNLSSILDYLLERGDDRILAQWFPADILASSAESRGYVHATRDRSAENLMNYLGVPYMEKYRRSVIAEFSYSVANSSKAFETSGFKYAYYFHADTVTPIQITGLGDRYLAIKINSANQSVVLSDQTAPVLSVELPPLMDTLKLSSTSGTPGATTKVPDEQFTVARSAPGLSVRLLIQQINGAYENNHRQVNYVSGILLIR